MGTNGGQGYTRPTTPPRSDTALVTTPGYRADTVHQLTVTGPLLGGASANLPTSGLSVGNHPITAGDSGDNTFPGRTGALRRFQKRFGESRTCTNPYCYRARLREEY